MTRAVVAIEEVVEAGLGVVVVAGVAQGLATVSFAVRGLPLRHGLVLSRVPHHLSQRLELYVLDFRFLQSLDHFSKNKLVAHPGR